MKSRIFTALIIAVVSMSMLSMASSNTSLTAAQGQQPLLTATPLFQQRLLPGDNLGRTVAMDHSSLTGQSLTTNEYLIPIPLPQAETLNVPSDLTPERVAEYARGLAYQQARPILAELEQLRTQGRIVHFEVQPDLFAVVVEVASQADVSAALAHLPAANLIFSANKEMPGCISGAAQALKDQVAGLSQKPIQQDRTTDMLTALSARLSIDIYAPPGSTWTYVTGTTTPVTSVSFRILRNGNVIAIGATMSGDSGDYSFYPTYQSCPVGGYSWTLQANDMVEVTTASQTVSTTVVTLSAWVDPVANEVGGVTAAGRSVEVSLSHYPNDSCTSIMYAQTAATNEAGAFSASFNSMVDFNRRASATVYARDTNGNSTFAPFYAYRIGAYFGYSSYWGYVKPSVTFAASLSRTGSIISTATGTSNVRGYYYGYFSYDIQAGDLISVTAGGVSMQYVATSLENVVLSPTANQVTGTTGPNRRVAAWFYKMDWGGPVQTTCSYNDSCVSTISNGSGNFTLHAGITLVRGDYAYLSVFDNEGNFQSSDQFSVPAITANLSWNQVSGYWSVPNANLTIILKDSGNAVIGSSDTSADSYDNSFYAYPGTLHPMDKIEVGDGFITQTMTIQNLTGRLSSNTGHLAGTAYNDHLLAQLWDFQRVNGNWHLYCSETNGSSGSYDLTFDGAQVSGQDASTVWSTGPDGHYTRREPQAFSINAQKDSNTVWGYSETPLAAITVTLKAGATTKAVYTTTAYSDGYYDAYGVATITQGDTVNVQTSDANSAVVNVPELTVRKDITNNRLYGRSPANEPVQTRLGRSSSSYSYYSYSAYTVADPAGNYGASFNHFYWSLDCSAVQTGHQCTWPTVTYYNASGHSVWLTGVQAAPTADSYEPDNAATTASSYTGKQPHTFDVDGDTDWVKFTVSAADVSKHVTYHLETLNLGFGMDTVLYLYDTDGNTLLAYNDDGGSGLASAIDWQPTAAGTYYILVKPFSDSESAYCDASYDMSVLAVRAKVLLPLVLRSNNVVNVDYFTGPFEDEPNNTIAQADGLLRSSQDYFGYPNDEKDYFSFISNASGSISINLTNYTGGNGQLQLFYRSTNNLVAIDQSAPFSINYSGPAGLYYIYLNTGSNYNGTLPYTLRVTYP
jgi:hypothetical protein